MFCSSIVSFEESLFLSTLNFVDGGILTSNLVDRMILKSLVVELRGTMIGITSLVGVEIFNWTVLWLNNEIFDFILFRNVDLFINFEL